MIIKNKNMKHKFGIFSITLNRLYYTSHCFKRLKNFAGESFEHIVVDNGSQDGTPELLQEEGFNIIRNNKNRGITIASIQGYRWLLDKKIDIIIKMDSDCELLTPDTLIALDKFFEEAGENYIISPVVKGIDTKPSIISKDKVGSFQFNKTNHIGGIFRAMKINAFTDTVNNCKLLNDAVLNAYFREKNKEIGYLPAVEVNHFETTKGQEKRYPEYFNKKYIY